MLAAKTKPKASLFVGSRARLCVLEGHLKNAKEGGHKVLYQWIGALPPELRRSAQGPVAWPQKLL